MLGLNEEEIGDFFMCTKGKVYGWIKLAYNTDSPMLMLKKIRAMGKAQFLAKQRQLAEKNQTVSIWLGKNYYDQSDEDKKDNKNDIEDLTPLAELLKGDYDDTND